MSDYDDMDADDISREVARRREDFNFGSEFWYWPDSDPTKHVDRPQPYAFELWACTSLLGELDEADEFNGMAIVPRPEGGFGASVNGTDGGEIYMRGDTRSEAIAKLWLRCHNEGLFDDEGGDEGDREYTDEELASAINNALWCEHEWSNDFPGSTRERLKVACEHLRDLSGAADKLDELQEEFDLFREWLESEKLETGDRIKRNPFATEKGLIEEQGRHKMCCKILEKLDEIKGE